MRRRSRARTRGAIFVEAIIIISTFVLLFLSMVFFRNMYLRKIQVARLARATVMAFSMQGCPDGQRTDQWASVDLDPNAGRNTPPTSTTPTPVPPKGKTPSRRANDIMKEIPGGSDGSQLNPIAELGFSMKASATTKTSSNPLAARRGYSKTMSSTSWVSCTEGIRGDSYADVMHYALDRFNLKKSSCNPPCQTDDADP
jgi:hypothetical protein